MKIHKNDNTKLLQLSYTLARMDNRKLFGSRSAYGNSYICEEGVGAIPLQDVEIGSAEYHLVGVVHVAIGLRPLSLSQHENSEHRLK